jgi:hypothetical protein
MGAGASFIDVEELTEALEQDFARVVPRTPRGSLDVASCDRGKVRQVVDGANERIKERYVAGWQSYTARKGAAVDELRDACAALVEDFHEAEPRCALPANTASALVEKASRHGAALHAALEGLVTKAGGEYVHGPTKKVERIKEKAENDYQGDVARVVDVERATGLFDSVETLNTAASAFRGTIDGLTVRRCKDAFFAHKHDSGYRDMKLFVEVADTGFIGELQLNLRQIQNIKGHAHKVYDVERVLEKGTDEALRRAIDGLDLESEQVLCLAADGGQSILDACGHVVVLEDALDEALPAGCEVANVYNAGGAVHAHVRLGIADVRALARLRDAVLFEGSFETAINAALPHDASQLAEKLATSDKMKELGFSASVSQSGRCLLKNERFLAGDSDSPLGAPLDAKKIRVESVDVHVDRGAFMECYARIMMRFAKLTMHQREKLTEVRGAKVAVLLAPAGGGKTFVAVQRVVQVLNEDPDATVLFVARNEALALFVCKWLVVASRKSVEHVVERVNVLVAPFSSGPRCVRVEALGGRRRLVLGETRVHATTYALIVVDEAHHLVGDSSLRSELEELGAAESSLLFLGDASQATAAMQSPEEIARSLVELPQNQEVVVATLSEVVRSTKRIVAGAAAFQLEAGRKAETSTHSASAGPPLVARIFTTSEGDDAGETYAREVVEALAAIRRQLVDLEDLDDRVAVVGPDEAFIEKLREPLARALGGFELVDAATASAVLPRGETEARAADAKQLLVVDSVDNMDGLERLVVICVGLDQVIDRGAGVLETRSRLYRAMTRAQLAVAVVNEALPGGWLEFLGRVELDDKMFDDAAERENRAETAADDVVGAVVEETSAPVATDGDATSVSKVSSAPARGSDGAQQASPNDAVDAPVAEKAAADANAATTPSQAEPMKVLQSIWDASAVATASHGDLRFMPFSGGVDLSKLVELRTLEGHSKTVRCGVHCSFVMIWLRRRSLALPCFRTGGASCLGRPTTHSRCGTWRPANAWRRWKGTRTRCVAASAVLS